jgi:lysozyme
MIINDAGRKIIMEHEGLELKAYRCPAGVLTIGYGHTRDPYTGAFDVEEGAEITEHYADELLEFDLERYEEHVGRLCPSANANQFSAMVSLCFNIGVHNFQESTLVKKFAAGDIAGAAAEFPRWKFGGGKVLPGLIKRRAAEKKLFEEIPS